MYNLKIVLLHLLLCASRVWVSGDVTYEEEYTLPSISQGYDCTPVLNRCVESLETPAFNMDTIVTNWYMLCLKNAYCEEGSEGQKLREEYEEHVQELIDAVKRQPPAEGYDGKATALSTVSISTLVTIQLFVIGRLTVF